jgi:hypothetical protein
MFLYQYKRENILININNRLFHYLFDNWNAPSNKQVCRLSSLYAEGLQHIAVYSFSVRTANAVRRMETTGEKPRKKEGILNLCSFLKINVYIFM